MVNNRGHTQNTADIFSVRGCPRVSAVKKEKGSGIRKMHAELTDYPEIELVLKEAGQTFQVQFLKKDTTLQPGQSQGRVGAE